MKQIPLTQGKFMTIDDIDLITVLPPLWRLNTAGNSEYAITTIDGKNISAHTLIMNPPDGYMVDHRDGNGLDNRRGNLRVCTNQQNLQNQRKSKNNTSGYKGVWWSKQHRKWRAECGSGTGKFIGLFDDIIEAAQAYDKRARELFGEFARTNF